MIEHFVKMEKREPCILLVVNLYSHYGKQYGGIKIKLAIKLGLPYNPATPLLDRYPKEMKSLS